MLFLLLQPPCIFVLLLFKKLLLELRIFSLLNLHDFIPTYFFLGILESLLVLFEVQCVLEVQLLLAVVHLRL
jgi:hypothetical protein